jgi:BRCA1-associated protein
VHRLLQNKEDGKLVEVHDPYNTTSQERSLSPGLSESQEGEVVHRKLEGFASQYYTLLKSQLEQQRIFYEGRLEEIRRDYDVAKPLKKSTDLIAALKQERNQLSQRLVTLETRRRKVLEDVSFLVSMNESLVANKEPLRRQIEEAQQQSLNARRTFEELLQPLQDKVTALMLQLEDEESDKKPAAL